MRRHARLSSAVAALLLAAPAGAGNFTPGPALLHDRVDHHAMLLPTGEVLVFNGNTLHTGLGATEIFESETVQPALGGSEAAGSTHLSGRPVLLPTGQVLSTGGDYFATTDPASGNQSGLAQRYDPLERIWRPAAPIGFILPYGPIVQRLGGQVTYLGLGVTLTYDPAADRWTRGRDWPAGMVDGHTCVLPDDRVLMIGQFGGAGIFDPDQLTWTPTGVPVGVHDQLDPTAKSYLTCLASGEALLWGGSAAPPELWDPATGAFVQLPDHGLASFDATATLLPSGRVLLVGDGAATLFDPATRTFVPQPAPLVARGRHTATLLPSGKVLLAGGGVVSGGFFYDSVASTELFDEDWTGPLAWQPTLAADPPPVAAGSDFGLVGSGFWAPSWQGKPVVVLRPAAGGPDRFAPYVSSGDSGVTATAPADLAPGPWLVRVVATGVPTRERPLTVLPPIVVAVSGVAVAGGTSVAAGGTLALSASGGAGGNGSGYLWELSANASGATLTGGGLVATYTAGPRFGGLDVVRISDLAGNARTFRIQVTAPPAVTGGGGGCGQAAGAGSLAGLAALLGLWRPRRAPAARLRRRCR